MTFSFSIKKYTVTKFLLFLFIFGLILGGLEYGAYYYFLNMEKPVQDKLRLIVHSIMELDWDSENNPPYHWRRNIFKNTSRIIYSPVFSGLGQGIKLKGEITFDYSEGSILSPVGNLVLNDKGFRGPFFSKEPEPQVYRILAVGGSQTVGLDNSEITYPRILERMLNNIKPDKNMVYELINLGHMWYNSCGVQNLFHKEALSYKPDLVLLMGGWDDLEKLRKNNYGSRDEYCFNENTFLHRSFLITFIKNKIVKPLFPGLKKESFVAYEVSEQNLKFFAENVERIVATSEKNNIPVGVISLPALHEKDTPTLKLKSYPKLSGLEFKEIEYQKKFLSAVDGIYRNLADKYSKAFYIDHGISSHTTGKELFFHDHVHPNGAGNRMLALGVLNALSRRINPSMENFKDSNPLGRSMKKSQLEIEYLKSLAIAFKIEDLSFTGCVAIHKSCSYEGVSEGFKSTFRSNPDKTLSRINYEYVLSALEFSFGSLLKFKESTRDPFIFNLLKNILDDAIKQAPEFSLAYWLLGQLYINNDQKKEGMVFLSKSYSLNAELEKVSFEKLYSAYQKRHKLNPYLTDLKEFIHVLKTDFFPFNKFLLFGQPNHVSSYMFFNILVKGGHYTIIRKFFEEQGLQWDPWVFYKAFYYTSPTLIHSTFLHAAKEMKLLNRRKIS